MVRDEPYERLQRARRDAGYRGPAEAAAAFGWNPHSYKSHENGTRGLRRLTAERYGRAYHVSAAWLLTGEGEPEERPSLAERELLGKYRALPEGARRIVVEVCELLMPGAATPINEPPPRLAKRGQR